MSLFNKKSPETSLTTNLKSERTARLRLADQTDVARASHEMLLSKAVQAANSDDPIALEKVSSQLAASEHRIAALAAATEQSDRKISQCENELSALVEAKTRQATDAECGGIVNGVERDTPVLTAALMQFADTMALAAAAVPEATGVSIYAANVAELVKDSAVHVVRLLQDHRRAVLAGAAPAKLAKPDAAPAVVAPPVEPETVEYLAAQHLRWRDPATGNLRMHPRGHRVLLPKELADKALALKAVVPVTSPEGKRLIAQQFSTLIPSVDHCLSLDAEDAAETATDPKRLSTSDTTPSQFVRRDRGPAYTAAVAAT